MKRERNENEQDLIRVVNSEKLTSISSSKKSDFFVFKLCQTNEDDDGHEILDDVTEYLSKLIKQPFFVLTRDIDMYVEKGDSK